MVYDVAVDGDVMIETMMIEIDGSSDLCRRHLSEILFFIMGSKSRAPGIYRTVYTEYVELPVA